MKNIQLFIIALIASFSIISCEEVVNVNLDTAAPKLVIDASIKWEKGTTGQLQTIKLTTTTDYYSTTIPVATGANVSITNTSLTTPITFQFIENAQTGEYICSNFAPVIGNTYTLNVVYKGETFTATSPFIATPVIAKTEQAIKPGIKGDDVYEIDFYFQDNGAEKNFYLTTTITNYVAYPEFGALTDEFNQGNLMFSFYRNDKLKQGDVVNFTLQGINEKYYDYMNKLLNIAGNSGGNPFAAAPSNLKGNIANQTNPDNFPYGFFQLSETATESYTIQ